jgi:hypothetical protein
LTIFQRLRDHNPVSQGGLILGSALATSQTASGLLEKQGERKMTTTPELKADVSPRCRQRFVIVSEAEPELILDKFEAPGWEPAILM